MNPHNVKIILEDSSAKIEQERIFHPTIGAFSLQETSTSNGLILIDFAATRNMVVASTRFKHLNIHKSSCISSDQGTRNQIDHFVINGRHCLSVLDVRTFRRINIDTDSAKIRIRVSIWNKVLAISQRKLDVSKLLPQQTAVA